MITVTIIGILALIAVPKFGGLLIKSKEGSTKGNLGGIRGALTIYYGDQEGQYPSTTYALTINGRYLSALPVTKLPGYHPDTSTESPGTPATSMSDAGGWAYVNNNTDANFGTLWVNCTNTDTKGNLWTSY